jgi:hypothetical protein
MPPWVWIVIAAMIAAAVVVLLASLAVGRRKRTERLKQRFGPEYDRTVATAGAQGAAEKELAARERQRDKLDIHVLRPAARQRFTDQWRNLQTAFVDDPADALGEADQLVIAVMRARGYPIDDFDQRAADISVDHPTIVENYRAAHAIERSQHDGEVDTEAQRQAFVHYRALFEKLLAPENDEHDTPLRHIGTARETSA